MLIEAVFSSKSAEIMHICASCATEIGRMDLVVILLLVFLAVGWTRDNRAYTFAGNSRTYRSCRFSSRCLHRSILRIADDVGYHPNGNIKEQSPPS